MTSRERVRRTFENETPDRPPFDLWALAGVSMLRPQEFKEVCEKYPSDFRGPNGRYGASRHARGTSGVIGTYVDEWNCEWTVQEVGVCGEVKHPPLADWSKLEDWTPPFELLDNADLSGVNASCADSEKFMRTGTQVRPFERMQFLRGTENLFMDLLEQSPEIQHLCKQIHEFNLRDMEMWAKTDVDGISFMDDWGTQHSLLIDPEIWRAVFKPMYRDYCDIIHRGGKKAFFHSDGYIRDIIPDLIEVGVDALNSQLFCMDIEELGRSFKGQIVFWGEICRQKILPFGTVDDVRAAVRRVKNALGDPRGGVMAQCEWGINDPRENIEAVFETWLEA